MIKIVTLNPGEVFMAKHFGHQRYVQDRRIGLPPIYKGHESPEKIENDSVGAEIAFAKAFNLYPDFTTTPRRGGVELISHRMLRVDVKQTHYQSGSLLVKPDTPIDDADRFVLVVGELPAFTVMGWCYPYEIMQSTNLIDLGFGTAYRLQANRLHEFKERDYYDCLIDDTRKPKR